MLRRTCLLLGIVFVFCAGVVGYSRSAKGADTLPDCAVVTDAGPCIDRTPVDHGGGGSTGGSGGGGGTSACGFLDAPDWYTANAPLPNRFETEFDEVSGRYINTGHSDGIGTGSVDYTHLWESDAPLGYPSCDVGEAWLSSTGQVWLATRH